MMRTTIAVVLLALLSLATAAPAADKADKYESGGPLAGLKLPLFPTQQGEPAGHPGAVSGVGGDEGLAPVRELSPGSVELYHAYMDKYLPIRSSFDRQSRIKYWTAPEIPGAQGHVEQYAAPLYFVARHGGAGTKPTGRHWKPVAVVRCSAGAPRFTLDLGSLDRGLYAVRVIGAVETKDIRPFRKPLYITMRVNDGLNGEINTYRCRAGYVDEFYSIAELYFHAVEKRDFRAELFVDQGSEVDLLVHTISLDDALAGAVRRPIKKAMTLHTPEGIAAGNPWAEGYKQAPRFTGEARLERDRAIWRALPPLNAQGAGGMGMPKGVSLGAADKTAAKINDEFGAWRPIRHGIIGPVSGANFIPDPTLYNTFLVNDKLKLTYTVDDLWARKPLPDPYPYKDAGAGFYFPDPKDPAKGRVWDPIAQEVAMRYLRYYCLAAKGGIVWNVTRNEDWARDGAVALVRYAWQFPAMDSANMLCWIVSAQGPAYAGDPRCRKRITSMHWQGYQSYLEGIMVYDMLYPYIKDSKELAASISRFVPWVKTPDDVIELLDVYLVQHTAKLMMRYQVHTAMENIAQVAAALADPEVSDPWMEFVLSGLFIYPNKPAGAQDLMISNTDRNGAMTIGSTSYAYQGAIPFTESLDAYRKAAGGAPQFDLNRFSSKPRDHVRWSLENVIAGGDFARIGDVCGPDKPPGKTVGPLVGVAAEGWRWARDPRWAWILKHRRGRKTETDAEWKEIEDAAATVKRAPWLDLPSRVLPNWFAALETGLESSDPKMRRAVYARVGVGEGHSHYDALDLQFDAFGVPMTIDGGQRSGYSKPNDRYTRIHNLVEVLDDTYSGYGQPPLYGWTPTLSDAEGARFMHVAAVPPPPAKRYERQVALIDTGAADSYIVDVFRVEGGKLHSYNFHGPISDDFQCNAVDVKPVEHVRPTRDVATDAGYLAPFEFSADSKKGGAAPDTLVATWRYSRSKGEKDRMTGAEQQMLGAAFDKDAPRKFTRLHLLDAKGLRVLQADVVCYKDPIEYRFKQLMAMRRGKDLSSAFAAVIEPYVGEPRIRSTQLLDVDANETDALAARAVEVQTANGHTDVLLADGRPDKVRSFRIANGAFRVAGEFAYVSTDAKGLRTAALTGGTTLDSPAVHIAAAARERTARIVKVDYTNKKFWIDAAWPETTRPFTLEIVAPGRHTTYTVTEVRRDGAQACLTVAGGADSYRSKIQRVVPAEGRVDCTLDFMGALGGARSGWTASNESQTRFWRADHLGGNDFKLSGAPVSEADFAPEGVLRLWEYGVGDTVRHSTFIGIHRLVDGSYEVQGDVNCEITIQGKTRKILADDFATGVVRF